MRIEKRIFHFGNVLNDLAFCWIILPLNKTDSSFAADYALSAPGLQKDRPVRKTFEKFGMYKLDLDSSPENEPDFQTGLS